ncbi:MAG: PPC domain-containing protein, partial [Lysobacter sp.]
SERDPTVAYLIPPPLADLGVTASANAVSVAAGQTFGFAVTARNHGPGRVLAPGIGFALDAELPSLSVTALYANWTCDAPQIANGKTSVACSTSDLAANAWTNSANFAVSATSSSDMIGKVVKLVVATRTRSEDRQVANDVAEASVAITASDDGATPIASPALVTGIAGAAGQARMYRIEVPQGDALRTIRGLQVDTFNGTGDITLYVKRGAPATLSNYDYISASSGNSETIGVSLPQSGTWYITLQGGDAAFDQVILKAGISISEL